MCEQHRSLNLSLSKWWWMQKVSLPLFWRLFFLEVWPFMYSKSLWQHLQEHTKTMELSCSAPAAMECFSFLLVGQGFISLNWYKISSIRYSTSDRLSVWDTPSTLDREFWNFMWGEIHVFRGQGHLRLPLVRSILMMFHMFLCVSVRDGHQNSSLMDHP